MPSAAAARRFHVHDCGADRHSGHVVVGAEDSQDAAILFCERWPGDADEVSLIVRDCDTGEEACFQVHLGSGEAEPCGAGTGDRPRR